MLTLAHSADAARPVAIPLAKTEEGELNAVFPNATVLQGLLLSNAIAVIVFLAKTIWDSFLKKSDKTEEKIDEMFKAVQELRLDVRALQARGAPDEDDIIKKVEHRIELMAFRAIREHLRSKGKDD